MIHKKIFGLITTISSIFFAILLTAGCQVETPSPEPTLTPSITPTTPPTLTPLPTATPPDPPTLPIDIPGIVTPTLGLDESFIFGFTYQNSDGNRYTVGAGNLSSGNPHKIRLEGMPEWLVSAQTSSGTLWVVVLADGRTQAFILIEDSLLPIKITPEIIPAGMPPLLLVNKGVPSIVLPPNTDTASTITHPVVVGNPSKIAYIEKNGDLVLWQEGEIGRLALNALPDARILQDDENRLLLLTDATQIYQHGVLGDQTEAGSITLVSTNPNLEIINQIPMPTNTVIEGIAPIWADINGDTVREIIITRANETEGARNLVYTEEGKIIATSAAIGRGYRWRHLLAVAPFGPNGELGIVDDLTPHIGGIIQLYQLNQEILTTVANLPGLSTHRLGSRNLDMVAAGDFDGNGIVELIVPNQSMNRITAVVQNGNTLRSAWTIELETTIATNFSALPTKDGKLQFGVGLSNQYLYIWAP